MNQSRAIPRVSALAPFRVRSFRFQWPADLTTSWAFEMETLILGWYVLVESGSILLLTVFASLQYIGTLIAPVLGVVGDRIGHRNLLVAMRAVYATLAATLMTFIFLGAFTPMHVLVIAGLMGLVRPSDIGVRSALVGATMPDAHLMAAMSIQRTTQDTARIAGALTGAGLAATLGMGLAYVVVVSLYATSCFLTLKAGSAHSAHHPRANIEKPPPASPWQELKAGLVYVWNAPHLFSVMCLAFLINLTAFPLQNGLLPYVAKEIYRTDQTGLGYMVAATSFGAVIAAIILSRHASRIRPARATLITCAIWYCALLLFSQLQHPLVGIFVLMLAGACQSFSQIPMAALILRNTDEQLRGRVMGIRMLAIYGNLPGLLIAGQLIGLMGYNVTAALYCVIGLVFTLLIAARWRDHLWRRSAPANKR